MMRRIRLVRKPPYPPEAPELPVGAVLEVQEMGIDGVLLGEGHSVVFAKAANGHLYGVPMDDCVEVPEDTPLSGGEAALN